MSIASPINLILASLFVVVLYWHFRPKPPVVLPRGPEPVVFRTYTPKTLIEFNGQDDRPVFLAVRGRVFDVTPGRNFYGPVGGFWTLILRTSLIMDRAVLTRTSRAAMRRAAWHTRASTWKC